jgi:predicted transcriptional regulator of viral defense system
MKLSNNYSWESSASIQAFFNQFEKNVFMDKELQTIFIEHIKDWKLYCVYDDFIKGLKQMRLKELELASPLYKKVYNRYSWGKPNKYQLGLSINPRAYLSHGTAMMINKLSNHEDKYIYINIEQSAKPQSSTALVQSRIDNAFKGKARKSKYVFECDGIKFLLLSGKNTDNLGIENKLLPNNKTVRVASIERTLIDIIVRPVYSGGVKNILYAYKKAKRKVSIEILLDMLNKMNYSYPYHQSIGLYLEMAGYSKSTLNKIRNLEFNYDFYLDYGMKKTTYSKTWKIHYPKGMI